MNKKSKKVIGGMFWVNWQVVDRPILILSFYAKSMSEVKFIEETILSCAKNGLIISHMIAGEITYYPDYFDQILEEKRNAGLFSKERWLI